MRLILYMVMSMDGIVAFDERTDIREYSSREDHAFFLREASACDAAVMGRFSYNPDISCKRKYLLSHSLTPDETDGNAVILSGEIGEIYNRLEDDGNRKVALLGGPRTNYAFLKAGFVNEIYLTVEPVLLGKGVHFAFGDLNSRWKLIQSIRLNEQGTVVHHYARRDHKAGSVGSTPDIAQNRWQDILHHSRFQDITEKLAETERDRIYCRHNLTHFLDTARIMYIMNLEEGAYIPKDIVYAAGLLHDIGRLCQYQKGIPHEKAGLPIADSILADCCYTKEERNRILYAISVHEGGTEHKKGTECREGTEHKEGTVSLQDEKYRLADILYRADKCGRRCFQCGAAVQCNWPEERKNTRLQF